MAFKVRMKSDVQTMRAIKSAVTLVITLTVGDEILTGVTDAVSIDNTSIFFSGLSLLGMQNDGTWSSTGLIGLISLIAGANLILSFIEISW